ncbi:peptide methionine sulfoxide reductase A4 [Hibiscus syriacus]|uniref:Peptide methionine sulfoxide reductase A4 n=1 Tax=Hibiscus syriacus TaxID=106335 RepID=A0A6A3AX38_HIBSY|nr:peptide methionine sulfoxide reductase A4 [Hibiscus syriacus]
MASIHRFKLLATQCAVASSPGRSPTTSPVVRLRRRKTLRMLLNRSSATGRRRSHGDQEESNFDLPPPPSTPPTTSKSDSNAKSNGKKGRRKLKELFVASPPFEERESSGKRCEEEAEDLLPVTVGSGDVLSSRGSGSLRIVTASFRYRLLRRAWRPMLVTISE